MKVRDEEVLYSDDFQLYMIYRGTSEEMMPEYELQTRYPLFDYLKKKTGRHIILYTPDC